MPDSEIKVERASDLHRQPIMEMALHDFVESEFAPGSGRCDKCGGGPQAQVHQKPVDLALVQQRSAEALERIAAELGRIASDNSARMGAPGAWLIVVLLAWGIGIWLGSRIPR